MAVLLLGPGLCAQDGAAGPGTVDFRGFPWGTSLADFIAGEGEPISRETVGGLVSLAYENRELSGRRAYMLVYFSSAGLEGGAYYFLTETLEEVMACYRDVQQQLIARYGPGILMDEITRERFPYESSWNLSGSYIHLKANTRTNEPVTLWYSSPALTAQLLRGS
jgi:hypothetical protein